MERSRAYASTSAVATGEPGTGESNSTSSNHDNDAAQRTTISAAQWLIDVEATTVEVEVAEAAAVAAEVATAVEVEAMAAETDRPDEIAAMSDRIRQALECPVCMDVKTDLQCFCPNGHVVCGQCVTQMYALDAMYSCPMCRTRLYSNASGRLTATRTMMVLQQLRVACRYREHGCGVLDLVSKTVLHEARCPYWPDVRCLVAGCHWLGTHDRLYAHVRQRHPGAVACTKGDRLEVTDMNRITTTDRRAYLVKTERGDNLLWVLMSRMSRNRIQTGVFAVQSRQSTARLHGGGGGVDDRLVYRITFFKPAADPTGRPARYKHSKTFKVGRWRSSLENAAVHDDDDNDKAASCVKFRCRNEGVVITWFERVATMRRPRVQDAAVPPPMVTSTSLAAAVVAERATAAAERAAATVERLVAASAVAVSDDDDSDTEEY